MIARVTGVFNTTVASAVAVGRLARLRACESLRAQVGAELAAPDVAAPD